MTTPEPYIGYYKCPICGTAFGQLFKLAKKSEMPVWQCPNNHSFDVAKQGYINLLPVQHKKSKTPGDDADMVLARQRFLAQGFYQPLRDSVVDIVGQYTRETPLSHLLDIGCGEGYYTQAMAEVVDHISAFDISKKAVQQTAKLSCANVTAMVASAAQVPVLDASVDIVSSIFSPIMTNECSRVLKPKGKLIIAKPQSEHLIELRKRLFDEVRLHDSDKFIGQLQTDFSLLNRRKVEFSFTMNNAELKNLLTMTPYAYRAKLEKRVAVEQLDELIVSAQFEIYVFEKNDKQSS